MPELEKKKRNENMDVKQIYPEVPTVIPNGLHNYFHVHLVRDKLRNIPSLYFNLKARVTCKNRMWLCFNLQTFMILGEKINRKIDR